MFHYKGKKSKHGFRWLFSNHIFDLSKVLLKNNQFFSDFINFYFRILFILNEAFTRPGFLLVTSPDFTFLHNKGTGTFWKIINKPNSVYSDSLYKTAVSHHSHSSPISDQHSTFAPQENMRGPNFSEAVQAWDGWILLWPVILLLKMVVRT